jgi:iron(III) transport system permease protein
MVKQVGAQSYLDRVDLSKVFTTIIIFGLFFPLIQLVASAITRIIDGSSDVGLILPIGRRFTLLVNSLGLAGSVAISVTVIGFLCGTLLLGEEKGVLKLIKWGFLLTAPVPPYIHALTWSNFVRLLQTMLGPYGDWMQLSGFPMSYCVNVLAYLPLGVGLALIGLSLIEAPAVEAARIVRGDLDVFTRVVLPLALPMVFTSLGLIFILVITDFSVPTLYSFNVYSLEVFSEFSASNNSANSLLLSIPLIISTLIILVYSVKGLRITSQSSSVGQVSSFKDWSLPSWFQMCQQIALGVAVLQVTLLVGGLLIETGSLSSLWYALTAAGDDIVTSSVISGSSALLGAVLGYVFADRLDENGYWWWLLSFPLALPASLIGISLIQTYTSLLPQLYGTMWMPIIASVTRFMPLSAIIVFAQKKKMDSLLFDAAELFAEGRNEAFWKVKLPLQRYGVIASALMIFTLSLGELGGTLLVIPPGRETLTIRIFNYLHYGGTEEVAGLCLALVAIMMTLTGLAGYAYNRSVSK